jgi:hypothetical protein
MKFINLIKESNIETELKEDITSGSVIVYHRTGRKGSPVQGIAADGYRVGSGDKYGVGVYTTYNLVSQMTDYHRSEYGSIIIESKVISMKDFLIFDYDIAKKIYGNKNYTLDKQLQLILGKELDRYKDDNELKILISKLNNIEYTSDIVEAFYEYYPDIISKLRGIVFTGRTDGKVLVSYDRKNVEPIRYTEDEGKTWKNIINRDVYKRLKGYDIDKNLEIEHIKNKLDTKRNLNNYEFNILLNNRELIQRLDNYVIDNLLINSSEPDKLINILLNNKELINILDEDIINNIIIYLKKSDSIINILSNNKDLISKLNTTAISHLLANSSEPEIIMKLINNKGEEYILNLDSGNIQELLSYSLEPNKILNILLNSREFISRLDINKFIELLRNSSEPKDIIYKLKNKSKEFISKLDEDNIINLLLFSKQFEKVINVLGNEGKELISRLDGNKINNILKYIKNPEREKQIIRKYRPDLFDNDLQENIKRIKRLL